MAIVMRSFVNAETQLRFNQPGTALNRILTEAPYLPRCSDNKTAALVRPAHYAIRYPYMQVNRTGMVSWLIFDLDHTNANIWDDVGLPAPNLIVRNRRNGHAHLYYAVVPVCTSENARAKPIQYMKAIYSAMAQKMEADEAYSGPVAKTPGHPWWATTEVHNKEYELGELAESVELVVTRWGTGPNMDAVSHSRHCTIFEELRFYAYSIVAGMRDTSSYTSFIRRLDAFAQNHNNFERRGFSSNLTVSQVKATVRSVARWTWDNYTGCSRCHRGAMSLDPTLPLYERQKLSAKRTHEKRQSKTESKIRLVCRQLLDRGEKLRKSVIAKLTALTRQTVAKYKHIINETVGQPDSVILFNGEASGAVENVNYGVHQISAFSPCLVIGTVIHSPLLSVGSSLSDTDTLLDEKLWPYGGDG
uniref:replication initiation protein n=1 Tax=Yersinia frederiksenii TaxID=29484 RepID=UPI001F4C3E69|nr:replication initiation protein [Yersinia frederiksenii]ULG19998.1 replication protein A [Yersinia frederiksenii]